MKILKVMLILMGIVILLVLAAGVYLKLALPNVGKAPEMVIETSLKRLERGRYLANHVTVCVDCHSKRDWTLYAAPMDSIGVGGGGEVFDEKMGFPGTFYAPNITPAALKNWTDGELFRAITTGVNKDGRALFPLMASHRFGKMDQEDIKSIIIYIRSLNPVNNNVPVSSPDFPVNFLINTMPKKAEFKQIPKETDIINYGGYLVNATGCVDCHSKMDKGKIITGTEFGGGMEFNFPKGIVRSPNITSHQATGIGSWTEEHFVTRFKNYVATDYKSPKVINGINTPMPWMMYGGMKTTDLKAIYAYLKALKPIDNHVIRFEQQADLK